MALVPQAAMALMHIWRRETHGGLPKVSLLCNVMLCWDLMCCASLHCARTCCAMQ